MRRRSGLTRLCLAGGVFLGLAGLAAAQAELDAGPAATKAAEAVAQPARYRMDEYRAPTPVGLEGATTIDTTAARRLFETRGAVFVDVLPRAPRPKGLPSSTIWRPKARSDIPGSIWLVDTGYGELAPIMLGYFRDGLAAATGGDKAKPIVFYCLRDCWMSWNAAKRAMAEGYTAVHWYPDGTDGWTEAGHPVERREPEPRPDE